MPDETPADETPTGGVVVPPIMDYEPDPVEPEPEPAPVTPPTTDGSPITDPVYPAPGEVNE